MESVILALVSNERYFPGLYCAIQEHDLVEAAMDAEGQDAKVFRKGLRAEVLIV
jgi:hypothetical protein